MIKDYKFIEDEDERIEAFLILIHTHYTHKPLSTHLANTHTQIHEASKGSKFKMHKKKEIRADKKMKVFSMKQKSKKKKKTLSDFPLHKP